MSDSSAAPAPTIPRPAATVLLVRDRPAFEVLMVRRVHEIDSFAGALVFPGGKIDPADADPAWADHAHGWDAPDGTDRGEEDRRLRIAGLREAFEESGVLLARDRAGVPWRAVEAAATLRARIAAGEMSFLEMVQALEVRVDLDALTVFAHWITPPFAPKRFDTWFFIATAPEDQFAVSDGYETVDAEWIEPQRALDLAKAGERKIVFPTQMNLRRVATAGGVERAIAEARARPPVIVQPVVEIRDGERYLTLPLEAGYGEVAEPMAGMR